MGSAISWMQLLCKVDRFLVSTSRLRCLEQYDLPLEILWWGFQELTVLPAWQSSNIFQMSCKGGKTSTGLELLIAFLAFISPWERQPSGRRNSKCFEWEKRELLKLCILT